MKLSVLQDAVRAGQAHEDEAQERAANAGAAEQAR